MDTLAEGWYSFAVRRLILIRGNVQGVGFRPAVYRYAGDRRLTGYVLNSSSGVTIEVQGQKAQVEKFETDIREHPPAASRIDSFSSREIDPVSGEKDFVIRFSQEDDANKTAGISPDLATCPQCLKDIFDRDNRRRGYAFTNCTNCGPRFTIIEDRPYDRVKTTMKTFQMCPACRKEYENPMDRRFHAQPNACPVCGPSLKLVSRGEISKKDQSEIERCAQFLKEGAIGAIKGLGGFHFACDPINGDTLSRLRTSKDRPHKAFALMMKDLDEVRKYCLVSKEEAEALNSSAAPIVLMKKRNAILDSVSPDNNYLGVMIPFTPLHHLLLHEIPLLVMTSANRRDEPLAIEDREVDSFLQEGIIDFYLTNNRPIAHRCDDSILQFTGERIQFIRRSRGYVPDPLFLENKSSATVLSSGANMKNTFSIRSEDKVFLSQHIGDLVDYRNLQYQMEQMEDFEAILDLKSRYFRVDAHPGYESYDVKAHKVFHHHAHMLSLMAENNLSRGPLTGVICDGTGYGTDGTIWGFEFLTISDSPGDFRRAAHLEYFKLPGGEKAISEIDRIAISLCDDLDSLPFSGERVLLIRKLIASGINCPSTSSLGRLFDGVTALCGLAVTVEYEARGAILLQREAEKISYDPDERYSTEVIFCCDTITIDFRILIKEILGDLKAGKLTPLIAWKFHKWVADSIMAVLQHLEKTPVLLSGGCFQNILLTSMIEAELKKKHYTYYMNRKVPPNDGGISLGQAFITQNQE